MGRKRHRVPYQLNARGLAPLPPREIRIILRGADDLIMRAGRNLLVKVLRGSRMKRVLELELDRSPVYGYYREYSDADMLARIDWLILHDYLALEYDNRLPLLVYTAKGWEIEKETYARELLDGLDERLRKGPPFELDNLKDRNRALIFLLLEKIEATGDREYIPLLKAWAQQDYRKVRQRIQHVIEGLQASRSDA